MTDDFGHGKPPLGIMPKYLWLQDRITELSKAITRYVEVYRYKELAQSGWIEELNDNMKEYARIRGYTIKND